MPEIKIRHELQCDTDTYFEKCLFNAEYNQRLFIDQLKFPGYKVLEQKDNGDTITRRIHISPPLDGLPGAVKKAVGDSFSYVEEGSYDKKTKRYTFKVIPSAMPDKSKTSGELWCEPLGDKKVARMARISVEVKVFMIGSMVEEKIMNDLKSSYDAAATFTDAFVNEKGY